MLFNQVPCGYKWQSAVGMSCGSLSLTVSPGGKSLKWEFLPVFPALAPASVFCVTHRQWEDIYEVNIVFCFLFLQPLSNQLSSPLLQTCILFVPNLVSPVSLLPCVFFIIGQNLQNLLCLFFGLKHKTIWCYSSCHIWSGCLVATHDWTLLIYDG